MQEATLDIEPQEKVSTSRSSKKGLPAEICSSLCTIVTNEVGKKDAAKIRLCVLITPFETAGYITVAYDGCKYAFAHAIELTAGYKSGEPVLICMPCGYKVKQGANCKR